MEGRRIPVDIQRRAPAYDCSIALVGVVVHFSKLSACACAVWKRFRSEAHCSIADIVGTLVEKMLNGETLLYVTLVCACAKEHKIVTQIHVVCMGKDWEQQVVLLALFTVINSSIYCGTIAIVLVYFIVVGDI